MKTLVKIELQSVAFLTGAIVMILEMVGSRILSPYFGASINTWSVLIGTILGSLSLGYWLGGMISDKGIQKKDLGILLFLSGFSIFVIGLSKNIIMNLILSIPNISLLYGSIITCLLLFLLPNIFLGMINPYLAKLSIISLKSSGSRMGNLSAISTVGSIIGTLCASFLLIPLFGATVILIGIGIILMILSIISNFHNLMPLKLFFIFLAISVIYMIPGYERYMQKAGLVDIDSRYGKILIYKKGNASYLIAGAFGYESSSANSPSQTYLPNLDNILSSILQNPKNALVIGGGTFNISNFLINLYPTIRVESVEIDEKVSEIANIYFKNKRSNRHSIYIEDGRTYINKSMNKKYDVILNDAYSDIVPPHHLLTKEAVQKISTLLTEKGIYVVNNATSIEGKDSWLLGATYKTISSVFPQVYVLPLENHIDKLSVQSVVIIAVKDINTPLKISLAKLGAYQLKNSKYASSPILSDEYAPVEYNLLSITTGKSPFHLSKKFLSLLIKTTKEYFTYTYSQAITQMGIKD